MAPGQPSKVRWAADWYAPDRSKTAQPVKIARGSPLHRNNTTLLGRPGESVAPTGLLPVRRYRGCRPESPRCGSDCWQNNLPHDAAPERGALPTDQAVIRLLWSTGRARANPHPHEPRTRHLSGGHLPARAASWMELHGVAEPGQCRQRSPRPAHLPTGLLLP